MKKPRKPLPRSTKPIKRSRLPSRSRKVRTKPQPRLCEAFREWIREQRCVVAQRYPIWPCRRPVDCAHVKSRGAGGADLGNCVPLCRNHHTRQHEIGIRSFQELFKIDLAGVAREHTERWLSSADGQAWLAEHPESAA